MIIATALDDLRSIANFLLNCFTNIINLFTGNFILYCSIFLLVLGRIVNIIRRSLPHG